MRYLFLIILVLSSFPSLRSQVEVRDSINAPRQTVVLYFPWDQDILHTDYMTNKETLATTQQLFSNTILLAQMDSIIVTATASPEGPPVYNQKLSERRLKTILDYIRNTFSRMQSDKIKGYALGADWQGLRLLIEADVNVPYREEVLHLIDSPMNDVKREQLFRKLKNGVPYRYINRNILRYLRTGATCVIFYPKRMDPLVKNSPLTEIAGKASLPPIPAPVMSKIPAPAGFHYIRPLALKTNLLFDAATLFNIEVEVPLGKHWSILGEWTFPWWGGLGNNGGVSPVPRYSKKVTMQMLSGGVEARYWFPRSRSLEKKATRWNDYNPLNGWFVGLYTGAGKYDFQLGGDGMQGEFFIAAGISAGYAHPIGKYLHMEYSLGLGYLNTEYYNYTPRDGHKVVKILPNGQYDRRKQTWFGLTKAKISLVWVPRFKVKSPQ